MKLQTVLIPLDGSLLAEAVLPKAVELAEGSGAKLLLLRATEAHTVLTDPALAQADAVRDAEEYLGQIGDRLGALGIKDVQVSVWYGPAASAIVEAARLYKVDLIAMTTHGRSGLGRLVFGSVAESVLRGTTTPILLIRVAEAPVEAPTGVAKPWPDIRHV